MSYTYIARCSDGSLYCGQTENLKRRIHEHNYVKSKAAKYTWARRPVRLVYSEKYSTIGKAMRREREIKNMPRIKKLKLITNIVEVQVRNYRSTDYDRVKKVLQEAQLFDETWDSPENLSGMIRQHKDAVLVAVDAKTVVGVVYLVPFGPKFIQLFRLAVKKDHRNLGIATKIINTAHEVAEKRGVIEVGLFVESKKSDLRSFYKKRGFGGSKKEYIFMWKVVGKRGFRI